MSSILRQHFSKIDIHKRNYYRVAALLDSLGLVREGLRKKNPPFFNPAKEYLYSSKDQYYAHSKVKKIVVPDVLEILIDSHTDTYVTL